MKMLANEISKPNWIFEKEFSILQIVSEMHTDVFKN